MQFTSLYFILFYLPITLAAYWLLNKAKGQQAANGLLLAASFVFYAFAGWQALLLLALGIIANWWLAWLLVRAYCLDKTRQKRFWLTVGVIFNVAILLYFKYTNFFLENLNAWFGTSYAARTLLLPLGISFTVFTQIAWLCDAAHGQTQSVSFMEYALYVAWFPKLTQGPVTFQKDFIPQQREQKRFDTDQAVRGICMFVLGLSKKLFLADRFGQAVDWGFQYIQLTNCWDMLIVMLSYTLEIYFDFSGYSDMALGISLLFGYELPQNFDSPYKALSITEFWRRWHMSLTAFLREYIYFPLGGSRKGKARTYLNIMIVYLVSGFWHGANWTFVLWGILHGAVQCAERAIKALVRTSHGDTDKVSDRLSTSASSSVSCVSYGNQSDQTGRKSNGVLNFLRWLGTFLIVNFLWLLFCAPSISEYNRALYHIFGQVVPISLTNTDLLSYFSLPALRFILEHLHIAYTDRAVYIISTVVYLGFSMFLVLVPENNEKRRFSSNVLTLVVILVLAAFCLLSLSGVSTFIYNNF